MSLLWIPQIVSLLALLPPAYHWWRQRRAYRAELEAADRYYKMWRYVCENPEVVEHIRDCMLCAARGIDMLVTPAPKPWMYLSDHVDHPADNPISNTPWMARTDDLLLLDFVEVGDGRR